MHPDYQDKGFGTKLFKHQMQLAVNKGKGIQVATFDEYNVVEFYEKLGLKWIGSGKYSGKPYQILYRSASN